MRGLLYRLGRGIRTKNPTVLLGLGMLLAGVLLTFAVSRPGPASDTGQALNRTLDGALQLAQQVYLLGRGAAEAPASFTSAYVAVFTEGLPPDERRWLGLILGGLWMTVFDLLSPIGLLTLVALILLYVGVAHAFDTRLEGSA